MSEKIFLIIDDNKTAIKLQENLFSLNYKAILFQIESEDIQKIIKNIKPELIFVNDGLRENKLKEILQECSIPIVDFFKEEPKSLPNNINPYFARNYLSENYSLHELQLVIEKAFQGNNAISSQMNDVENELKHSRSICERYGYIYEHTGLGLFQSTIQGKFISVNKAFAKMLGYNSPKELTDSVNNISSQIYFDAEERKTVIQTLFKKNFSNNHKIKCRRKDGIIIMLKVHYRLLVDSGSKNEYIEGIAEDYTYHNRAKDALKDNILQLKESHKLARLGSFQKDCMCNKYFFSDNFFEILDISDEKEKLDFTEKTLFNITHPEDREFLIQIWTSGIAQKLSGFKTSFRIIGNSGKIIHLNLDSVIQYNNKYEVVNLYVAIQDITEQKLTEEQLKVSLVEKEVLLREINHRVKNNLQVVSSILNLQSDYVKDKKTIEILNECRNRIFSMSLVHEKLCQTNNLALIDYKIYLKDLLSNIIYTYNLNKSNISINLEIESVFFSIDIAIPCGMIINELVSNAVKYAFPDNKEGKIDVKIEKIENKEWMLTISDNGVGFAEKFDKDKSETLGLKLVDSLIEQINGSIEYKTNKGLKVIIIFKEK